LQTTTNILVLAFASWVAGLALGGRRHAWQGSGMDFLSYCSGVSCVGRGLINYLVLSRWSMRCCPLGGDFSDAWTWIEGGQDCRVRGLCGCGSCMERGKESKVRPARAIHTYRGQEEDKDSLGVGVYMWLRPPHFFYFSSGSSPVR
jgi:hypothetical protein